MIYICFIDIYGNQSYMYSSISHSGMICQAIVMFYVRVLIIR